MPLRRPNSALILFASMLSSLDLLLSYVKAIDPSLVYNVGMLHLHALQISHPRSEEKFRALETASHPALSVSYQSAIPPDCFSFACRDLPEYCCLRSRYWACSRRQRLRNS